MTSALKVSLLTTSMLVATSAALAGGMDTRNPKPGTLPDVECTRTQCKEVYNATPRIYAVLADPTLDTIGPPAGQRFQWRSNPYGSCVSVMGGTFATPSEYMVVENIPVPLGSTHATLNTSLQVKLRVNSVNGYTSGSFGFLEIKRSTSTVWEIADQGYALAVPSSSTPGGPIWFTKASYHALENLATLSGGSGVPNSIDVRVAFAEGGAATVEQHAACGGLVQVDF
ncbi:MAG TPA: hypothetical protein VFN29_09890 [Chiayiivirga sp.]|nr:hypothetical protein [Chiayiivirga sp.]